MSEPQFAYADLAWSLEPRLAYFVDKLIDEKGYSDFGPYQSKWRIRFEGGNVYLVIRTPTLSNKSLQSLVKRAEELISTARRDMATADKIRERLRDAENADTYVAYSKSVSRLPSVLDALADLLDEDDPLSDIPRLFDEVTE